MEALGMDLSFGHEMGVEQEAEGEKKRTEQQQST